MNKWWKNPCLQGPENDYGDYDYLATELPENSCGWEFSKYKFSDDNGHESHLRKVWRSYFYTMDGYDYMSGSDCWRCYLKSVFSKLKRKYSIKNIKKRRSLQKLEKSEYKALRKFEKEMETMKKIH